MKARPDFCPSCDLGVGPCDCDINNPSYSEAAEDDAREQTDANEKFDGPRSALIFEQLDDDSGFWEQERGEPFDLDPVEEDPRG